MRATNVDFKTRLVIFMTCHILSKPSNPTTSGTLANVIKFLPLFFYYSEERSIYCRMPRILHQPALELNYVDVYHCKEKITREHCERES
jgi:hypothetical protein